MDPDEIDVPETWSTLAGYVPLLEAEDRLAVTRRALVGTESLIQSLQADAASEAADHLVHIQADAKARLYETETREYLEDRLLSVRRELPLMQYGVLVVYLFSLLESCLAGCLEEVCAVRAAPVPGRVPNPKIEGYLRALKGQGVSANLSQEAWEGLSQWRSVRNSIVHRLEEPGDPFGVKRMAPTASAENGETLTPAGIKALAELIEEVIEAVDLSMSEI